MQDYLEPAEIFFQISLLYNKSFGTVKRSIQLINPFSITNHMLMCISQLLLNNNNLRYFVIFP